MERLGVVYRHVFAGLVWVCVVWVGVGCGSVREAWAVETVDAPHTLAVQRAVTIDVIVAVIAARACAEGAHEPEIAKQEALAPEGVLGTARPRGECSDGQCQTMERSPRRGRLRWWR